MQCHQLKQKKADKYLVSLRKSSNLLRIGLVFLNMMSRQVNSAGWSKAKGMQRYQFCCK